MAQENSIVVGGLRTRYLEEGSGPAVLLLHGASLGSSADVWSGNLGAFAGRGLRAIAVDLPGFGKTDNPDDHTLGFRTRFVPQLLDALELDRAHVIGHSQSGRIPVSLALSQPDRLARIVVVGTAGLLPPLPGASKADAGEADEGGTGEPTLEETRATLEKNLFNHALITPEVVALRQRMSTGKNYEAFVERQGAKSGATKKESQPLWQRLGEVQVPMRLIYGKQDRSAAERAALAKERFPQLDLHLLDRCRHLVQWDAPTEFAALAGDFLT